MSELSPRLGLPFLMAAQAQKHVTHNEALLRLDQVTQLVLQGLAETDPPGSPDEGQVWALGASPTGDWAGQGGDLALWFDGAWHFVTPAPGWQAGFGTALVVFDGSDWVAPDLPTLQNLPGVGINASFDAINRLTVAAEATLLNHEGAGHQLKLNKAANTDTASLLFQAGFSGRAEMGTAGSDDFSIKVSADGSAWHDGLTIARASGLVTTQNGLTVTGALTLPAASVTRAALANGTALSLIGRSASTSGAVADIAAGSDHQVMRRSGTSIGFGAVALSQSAAVTGQLPLANGGTGASTASTARTNLGLGTAATADITTSTTDMTQDRVLRVRDFGLGWSHGPNVTDWDNNTGYVNGFFAGTNAAAGSPPPSNGAFRPGLVMSRNVSGSHRSAIIQLVGTNEFATRAYENGAAVDSWRRIYSQNNILGTVSQTAGVPTGAVIQRGSNANGEFVRFADGTQICTARRVLTVTATLIDTVIFPAAFSSESVVLPIPDGNPPGWINANDRFISVRQRDVGTSGTRFLLSATPAGGNFVLKYAAFGRWF